MQGDHQQDDLDPEVMKVGHLVDHLVGDLHGQWSVHRAHVGIGREQTGHGLEQDGEQQRHDHQSADRIVAGIVRSVPAEHFAQMAEDSRRPLEEAGKARGRAAEEAPQNTEQHQGQDGVTGPEMELHPIPAGLAAEI